MNALRFAAIALIFGGVTLAWMALGGSVWVRTEMQDTSASEELEGLWGPKVLVQSAPYVSPVSDGGRTEADSTAPSASTITADIEHEHRDKGLLWYSTFTVTFSGTYTIPADADAQEAYFLFALPEGIASHDGLTVTVDGSAVALPQAQKTSGRLAVKLDRTAERTVAVSFATYGQDIWLYAPGDAKGSHGRGFDREAVQSGKTMSELSSFSLTIQTDFANIDYPTGSRSPTQRATPNNGGMTAARQYASFITKQPMGIAMPKRMNPGPIAARMSFFAPVSLFFFFTVLFVLVVLKKIPLHPMHYLFIAAGFFAFHILLAYLADVVSIHVAFWICATVSTLLVVSYMRLVAGMRFAVTYVGLAQLVYLVGFSYAFFWQGRTGLTVTIGAIATLLVLMQATGRLNWQETFRLNHRSGPSGPQPSLAPVPPPPPPPEPELPPMQEDTDD